MFRIEIPEINASAATKMFRDDARRRRERDDAWEQKFEATKKALRVAHEARAQKLAELSAQDRVSPLTLLWSDREWWDTVRLLQRLYSFEIVDEASRALSIDVH